MRKIYLSLLLLIILFPVKADTIYVATNGSDIGTGKFDSPYRTILKGIDIAVAGDIIFLRNGLYHERITFKKSGTAGKPIVLSGEDDAIIDGGTLITGWQKVYGYGGNIYRLPYTGKQPYNLTWNNKYILRIRDEFMSVPGMFTILSEGPEGWDTYDGPPYRGWNGVSAMWGTYQGYIYIGFGDSLVNPNDDEITYTPSNSNGGAVITISGRQFIEVRGLKIKNGYNGVYITNSSDCLIEKNSIVGGHDCIQISKSSSRIHINKNSLTLGYVHSLDPDDPRHWFIWAAFKLTSDWDRICVSMNDLGSDIVVSENHMFQNFDGVQNQGSSLRLIVRDNIIEQLSDDALEPDGEETEARWHGNIVSTSNIGYRHKNITGSGPMYVYDNKFYSRPGNTYSENLGIYFFSGTSTTAYIYHNSFATTEGFNFGTTNVSTGVPNVWLINNLFSSTKIYSENSSWTKKPHIDFNYFGGNLSSKAAWWGSNNKIVKNGQIWSQTTVPDFLINSNSEARETGVDISMTWMVQGLSNTALIGYSPDYFYGLRPDAGAEQYFQFPVSVVDFDAILGIWASAYPNPFHGECNLIIRTVIPGKINIQIVNLNGSLVFNKLINRIDSEKLVMRIDLNGFPQGIYILKITNGQYVKTIKLTNY